MLVVVTAMMLLVLDTLAHILVVSNLEFIILDHILVGTGLDTSHMMGRSPIADAHRCQRCTLQLGNSAMWPCCPFPFPLLL